MIEPKVSLQNNKIWSKIYLGNSLDILPQLEPDSVDCVLTSPPYWGLREYGTAQWDGGNPDCDHLAPPRGGRNPLTAAKQLTNAGTLTYQYTGTCKKCGAIRIDDQLGTETSFREYVENMVDLFAKVRRVLKSSGTLWLNLGDTYNGSGGAGGDYNPGGKREGQAKYKRHANKDLKPKDLVGIPWRVALALQDDGWWLRSDIIWHKLNPMVEGGAVDRPSRSHEYVFLMAKSSKYFYNLDKIKVPNKDGGMSNIRTVWTMPNQPFGGAHFATMPRELARRCIVAGCPEGGTVLDPFNGSATTGFVAAQLGCNYIGIELNEKYIEMSEERLRPEINQTRLFYNNEVI